MTNTTWKRIPVRWRLIVCYENLPAVTMYSLPL